MTTPRSRFAVASVCALATLSGCASYSGVKLGDSAGGKSIGIPYTLVRPEYALTRMPPAEGQKKATYVIGVTYEPDPKHRYTLKISPGLLADPNFALKLGTGGVMQSTSLSITEQLTPTITALGSFSANLIGALATGVFDKDSVRRAIMDAFTNHNACNASPPDLERLYLDDAKPATVGAAMAMRIKEFGDDAAFAELFHYATDKELHCLIAARDELKGLVTSRYEDELKRWHEQRTAYGAKNKDDFAFLNRLATAVATDDTKELETIAAELKHDAKSSDQAIATRSIMRSNLFALARSAATAKASTDALAKVQFFIDMDAATWKARHLLYLEREIERATLASLRRPDFQKTILRAYMEGMRAQRAITIGALDLFMRSMELEKFIAVIRSKSVEGGGTAPATAEYATARAEHDAITAQIEARRARVIADAKPAPAPVAPLKLSNLKVVTRAEITKSTEAGWIHGAGVKAPDYVMVLEGVE